MFTPFLYHEGAGSNMSQVIKVEKTKNFMVMSNYHMKDKELTLKAKGILWVIFSLPENRNYNIRGLVKTKVL